MIVTLFFHQNPTSVPEHPLIADVTQRLRRLAPTLTEVSRDEEQICWTTVHADELPTHETADRRVGRLVKRLMNDNVISAYRVLYEEYAEIRARGDDGTLGVEGGSAVEGK